MRVILLAILAFSILVYTYVGYPILIGVLARLRPLRIAEDPTYLPKVTACIPVYNAASYLTAKVESLLALDYPADKIEILLYSDGSDDDTNDVAAAIAARDPPGEAPDQQGARRKAEGCQSHDRGRHRARCC